MTDHYITLCDPGKRIKENNVLQSLDFVLKGVDMKVLFCAFW